MPAVCLCACTGNTRQSRGWLWRKSLQSNTVVPQVYTSEPKTKAMISKEAFQEVSREFVLDIDLTDYQEDGTIVTNCIDPSDPAFTKSWRFMAISCQVLDTALRVDFGFKHLLWVFSGRRGIHCWVCDDRARHMSNSARSAVAEYLSCLKVQATNTRTCTCTCTPAVAVRG